MSIKTGFGSRCRGGDTLKLNASESITRNNSTAPLRCLLDTRLHSSWAVVKLIGDRDERRRERERGVVLSIAIDRVLVEIVGRLLALLGIVPIMRVNLFSRVILCNAKVK